MRLTKDQIEENRRINNARVAAIYKLPMAAEKLLPDPVQDDTRKVIIFDKGARKPKAGG